jgi:hypothetical protein
MLVVRVSSKITDWIKILKMKKLKIIDKEITISI